MHNRRHRIVMLWPLAILVAVLGWNAYVERRHESLNVQLAVAAKAEHAAVTKRIDRAFNRIDSKGTGDEETWRLIMYAMEDPDLPWSQMAFPLLQQLVTVRPIYRSVAWALLEAKAVRTKRSDVHGKWLLLVELAALIGAPPDRITYQAAQEQESRVAAMGRIDTGAAKFAENALANKRLSVQINALPIMLRAATMQDADRSWALKRVEQQLHLAEPDTKRYWTIAREAMIGRLKDY